MGTMIELPTADELAAMGAAELEAALEAMERARRLVEARTVDALEAADVQRVWAGDGHRSVRAWAVALTGVSSAEAGRRCQLMRTVRDLPGVRAALAGGDLGVCQARELARVHADRRVRIRLARAEQLLARIGVRRTFDDFRVRLRRWHRAADPDGAARSHDEAHEQRRAEVRATPFGVTVTAHGGAVPGAELVEVFAAFLDAEIDADWEAARAVHGDATTSEHLARTAEQRSFDAVCAIFRAAADGGSDVRVPTVDIVCDDVTLVEHLAHAVGGRPPRPADPDDLSRRCETLDGVPVDPRDAVVAAVLGHVRRVVYDAEGVVIDLGRRRRLFTGGARDAVWLQGRRCIWPGCGLRAHEQDHVDGWASDGGPTDPRNGAPVCGRHNRWKARGYPTWRDADGVWHVRRPDGTDLTRPRAA